MRNKRIFLCFLALLLAVLPLSVSAQELTLQPRGSISVTLASGEQPMAGAELSVYHIATVGINAGGNLNYNFTRAFRDCGLFLEDPDMAEKLDVYVSQHTVASQTGITDAQGKVLFGNLPLGLYLIRQIGDVEGFASCAPFLVTVPVETESGYQYHVDASPKTDVVRLTDITIEKVWNTGSASNIPGSITVQLLHHDQVVETAILSSQNNWQITYENMPESDAYSIREVNIPQGFTATYRQTGYVFTVTNTPALAQTGQLVWPIPVFALAGMVFLMLGVILLRKSGKRYA